MHVLDEWAIAISIAASFYAFLLPLVIKKCLIKSKLSVIKLDIFFYLKIMERTQHKKVQHCCTSLFKEKMFFSVSLLIKIYLVNKILNYSFVAKTNHKHFTHVFRCILSGCMEVLLTFKLEMLCKYNYLLTYVRLCMFICMSRHIHI